ncbi:MAG TPA: CocE/NonD family hydrolase, partial [Polyangiales bacterium]|nr:CocE/NonD family hydrolase [Polyangiales bacterium]
MSVVLSCLLLSVACRDTEALGPVPKTRMNSNTGAGSDAKAGAGGSSGAKAAGSGGHAGSSGAKAGSGGSAGVKAGSGGSSGGGGGAAGDDGAAQVSRPGVYRGYSEVKYSDEYQLSSEYVAVRDGTKLAVDLYRPKDKDGKVVETPLPVLWMHTPYNRRWFSSATVPRGPSGETYPGNAARLVKYGYVVAIADFRGLYASYGKNIGYNRGEWVESARNDAYDITEWLAMQPWSTGKIGMWGCSATGGSQLQAASSMPPHLKAIFPMSCEFDAYPFAVWGGMAPPMGMATMAPPMETSPAARDAMAEPVDADEDRTQLMAAIAEHAGGSDSVGYVPFRDSKADKVPLTWWVDSSPSTYVDKIAASNVGIYLAANWDEATTKHGAFYSFNNLKNPRKLIVGPGAHCAWTQVKNETGFEITIEELRFFDYWLKDIKNGVMDEPGVYYYTYNAPPGTEWRSSPQWPLPNERRTSYYLTGVHGLSVSAPSAIDAREEITVDYDVTADNLLEKGLVYESPDLTVDLQVTGHPQVNLFVTSTATDGDFIATLQDVAPDGTAKSYNSSGRLRASHRKLDDAPYESMKLPWHRSQEADVMPLTPGESAELRFEMLPMSMIFQKGHRIRLVLTFAAGRATPRQDP